MRKGTAARGKAEWTHRSDALADAGRQRADVRRKSFSGEDDYQN
ncbi:hypothetical protein ACRS85_24310 [Pluralibacter gergoviae]